MDDELLTKAREAIEARLKAVKEEKIIQYNLVIPVSEAHMEQLLRVLDRSIYEEGAK